MKNTTKYIVITLAILVVLGGAFAALYFTDPSKGETESSVNSEASSTSLIAKDITKITSVDVKNKDGSFTIVQTPKKAESSAASEATEPEMAYGYTIKGFEKYAVDEATLGEAVKNTCELTAAKELGTVDDLTQYGLSGKEAGTVTANLADGSKETFIFGIAAGETEGRYVLYGDKVYICAVNTAFQTSMYTSFQNFTYTIADLTDESGQNPYSIMNKLDLSGTNFKDPIKMKYDEEKVEFRMSSPYNTDCGIGVIDTLTAAMKTITTTSVVAANATEADLKKYGLDKPFASVDFNINGTDVSMAVSEQKVDGARYMYANGDKTIIYTVAADLVAPWAETTAFKLRNSYVFLPMITSVDEFTIEAGDKTCTVDLSRTKNDEKSSETQTIYDYTAKKNGKDIVYDDVTKFYMSMISIAALSDVQLEYEKATEVKFTFKYYDGNQDVLEYHKASDGRLVALLNGNYSATVRATSINDFLTAMDEFLKK